MEKGCRCGDQGWRNWVCHGTPLLLPQLFRSSVGRSAPAGWRLGSWNERVRGTSPSCVHAPLPVVFPTRTISTYPSTSRPASCSVGESAPARSAVGGGLLVAPCHQRPGAVKVPVEMPYSSDLFALQGGKHGKSVLAPCFLL